VSLSYLGILSRFLWLEHLKDSLRLSHFIREESGSLGSWTFFLHFLGLLKMMSNPFGAKCLVSWAAAFATLLGLQNYLLL